MLNRFSSLDFDFFMRRTTAHSRKLKGVADALGAVVFRPEYPASDLVRLLRDDDNLQVDFMTGIHGAKSFNSIRSRATQLEIAGEKVLVAALADIIASKRAAGRPRDKAVLDVPTRTELLEALRIQSELDLKDQIRRLLAKPMNQRTHFLRKRVGICSTAL